MDRINNNPSSVGELLFPVVTSDSFAFERDLARPAAAAALIVSLLPLAPAVVETPRWGVSAMGQMPDLIAQIR